MKEDFSDNIHTIICWSTSSYDLLGSLNTIRRVFRSTLCIRLAFYFCYCCKFQERQRNVRLHIENLEIIGLYRFHYISYFLFIYL